MAENHYVDPKDQTGAAEGVADHSDLTTVYPAAKKEQLSPWMHESARQAALEKTRTDTVAGLRKSIFTVGLALGLPVSLGLVSALYFLNSVTPDNALTMFLLIVITLAIYFGTSYALLAWASQTFRNHTLKASPVMLTILISLLVIIQPSLNYAAQYAEDFQATLLGAGIVLVTSIILSVASLLLWSIAQIPAIFKVLFLAFILSAAIAVAYL
jgi:hypothetical protein